MLRALLRCPALVVIALVLPLAAPALADDVVPPAPAASPSATELRMTAPASVPAGSDADVWVRLVAPGDGGESDVPGQPVVIQRQSSSGWSEVASFTTNRDGLAHGPVAVPATGHFRAYYRGSASYATATSRDVVISATTLGDRAIAEAKRHKGATYRYGAAGPDHFDCSGFTMYVFGRLGKRLPHSSSAQAGSVARVANGSKRVGDLIFTFHGSSIGHVGIYAGGSQMWASVQSGDTVRLQDFSGRTYRVGRVG